MGPLPSAVVQRLVREALAEDIGPGDATSLAVVPETATARAVMAAREPLVVAGLIFVETVFAEVGRKTGRVRWTSRVEDGQAVGEGGVLAEFEGSARSLLTGERTALNYVQRLSGIATLTAQFVDAVRGTGAVILDTRKTTPGWRVLEKYAVRCGGGRNHRMGLFDQVLVKDNHLAAMRDAEPNAIAAAVRRAREAYPSLVVEVEADSLEQVRQAVEAKADVVLLDNMAPSMVRAAVALAKGKVKTEASGGVNLVLVRAIAESGVDFISVGALTHSARAVDIGLDFVTL